MADENQQESIKYNPKQVKEEFVDKKPKNIKVESDKERVEKYGYLGATILTEGENYVNRKMETVNEVIDRGKEIKADYEKGAALAKLPLEEQIAQIEKEKTDEENAKKLAEQEKQAEKDRLDNLKKQYIVNGAMIECSCSPDRSFVIIPVSHGEYINDIAELNIGDCLPNTNIVSFKICKSPSNPSVKDAAEKVLKEAQDRNKGFSDRFMDLFGAPKEIDKNKIDSKLLAACAGDCMYAIDSGAKWIDGKEDVIVDGEKALLGRCTITCIYGGVIKFYTSGQEKQ